MQYLPQACAGKCWETSYEIWTQGDLQICLVFEPELTLLINMNTATFFIFLLICLYYSAKAKFEDSYESHGALPLIPTWVDKLGFLAFPLFVST